MRGQLRRRLASGAPPPLAAPAPPPAPDAETLATARARADPELAARLARLDPWQQAAVTGEGERIVDAHVGSGKTTVLAARAAWLHRVEGVPADRIFALTFTTRAAEAIATALAGAQHRVGTFHAVALSLLRETGEPAFVLGDEERWERLERLAAQHGEPLRCARRAARAIDRGSMPELAAREREAPGQTFDELLDLARERIAARPLDPPPAWVLVDELQDCTPRELALVEALRDAGARLFAVGDPHQSIYGWRGSNPARIEGWRRARGLPSQSLPACYRCPARVVALARALLPTGAAPLLATRPDGQAPVLIEHHDASAEAHYLAGRLPGLSGSTAILARTRRQLATLADALAGRGVDVHLAVRPTARDLPAPYFALRLLRAALLDDVDSARFVLGHPRYGVLRSVPLVHRVHELRAELPTRATAHVDPALAHRMLDDIEALRRAVPTTADALLGALHLADLLRPTAPQHARDLAQVRDWFARWLAAPGSLTDAVAGATIEGVAPPEQRALPQLMTIHAAKGLEFDHVVVSGVNEGRLPLAGENDPVGLAEERRLLYVAATRARETLELSWHTNPDDPRVEPRPSRFLDDAPLSAPSPAGTSEAPSEWTIGQAVRHPRYGEGEIVETGDEIAARFGRFGIKRFHRSLCPLEQI